MRMPDFIHEDHKLSYREQGRGPLLLVLPGNTASSVYHEGEVAYFGQRFHAVSFDYRGTGQSDRVAVWPADWFQRCAADAAALVTHLGHETCITVGTSGGAIVALWLAINHPRRVTAVIADSMIRCFPADWLAGVIRQREQQTPEQVRFYRGAHGDDWQQVVAADSAMLRGYGDRELFDGRLRDVACPVLLTASLGDTAFPQEPPYDVGTQLVAMTRQLPDARAFLAKEGDHPLMWSDADLFREVSDWFLQRQNGREQQSAAA